MKKNVYLILFILLFGVISCGPSVSSSILKNHPALSNEQKVFVLGLNQSRPESSIELGEVKVGDTGFSTNCGYELAIEKAKIEARKVGGNVIKIITHKPPSLSSSCHKIIAKILKVDNIESITPTDNNEEIIDSVDYSIIHVYRYGGVGSIVGYDLYLEDSLICRVKNKFKTTLHIKKEGRNTLWAKTEAKSEVPIELKKGKTYYLRCSIKMGAFVGHPHLELVDSELGKSEFASFEAKHE